MIERDSFTSGSNYKRVLIALVPNTTKATLFGLIRKHISQNCPLLLTLIQVTDP